MDGRVKPGHDKRGGGEIRARPRPALPVTPHYSGNAKTYTMFGPPVDPRKMGIDGPSRLLLDRGMVRVGNIPFVPPPQFS
jgi:hypothetical protein